MDKEHYRLSNFFPKWRRMVMLIGFIATFLLLTLKAAYLSLSPANEIRSDVNTILYFDIHHESLDKKLFELNRVINNIEEYSLSEIRVHLKALSQSMTGFNKVLKSNIEAWDHLKKEMQKDSKDFKDLKNKIIALENVKENEFLQLSELMSEAKNKYGRLDFFGYLLSFVVGVLSSMAASKIERHYKRSHSKQPE